MSLTEALISGLVQGFTEFLPVSSSGHLVLTHWFFGFRSPGMFFDICLHFATLGAVVVYFKKDIAGLFEKGNRRWILFLGVGTLPAVVAALLFEDNIDSFFNDPRKVAGMLVITGIILFIGDISLRARKDPGREMGVGLSFLTGIAQAFALLPGISRSGITISAGLTGGLKPSEAFRFSFLLSVPAIAGAVVYGSLKLGEHTFTGADVVNYAGGMLLAFLAGLVSIHLLWRVIQKRLFFIFGIYCLVAGSVGILLWK